MLPVKPSAILMATPPSIQTKNAPPKASITLAAITSTALRGATGCGSTPDSLSVLHGNNRNNRIGHRLYAHPNREPLQFSNPFLLLNRRSLALLSAECDRPRSQE